MSSTGTATRNELTIGTNTADSSLIPICEVAGKITERAAGSYDFRLDYAACRTAAHHYPDAAIIVPGRLPNERLYLHH